MPKTLIDEEICIRCGESVFPVDVSLHTVMQINKMQDANHIERLCELEGISKKLAKNWFDHLYLGTRCNQTKPPCPSCGEPLGTWHAKLCTHCNWKRDSNKLLAEYL